MAATARKSDSVPTARQLDGARMLAERVERMDERLRSLEQKFDTGIQTVHDVRVAVANLDAFLRGTVSDPGVLTRLASVESHNLQALEGRIIQLERIDHDRRAQDMLELTAKVQGLAEKQTKQGWKLGLLYAAFAAIAGGAGALVMKLLESKL